MSYRKNYTTSPPQHAISEPQCSRIWSLTGNSIADKCYCPSQMNDVFDGYHYRTLQDTLVTISSCERSYCHFSNSRDIALGFSQYVSRGLFDDCFNTSHMVGARECFLSQSPLSTFETFQNKKRQVSRKLSTSPWFQMLFFGVCE